MPNVEQPGIDARCEQSQREMGVAGAPESAVYESSTRMNILCLVDEKTMRWLSLLR